jgi:hypothetical protein
MGSPSGVSLVPGAELCDLTGPPPMPGEGFFLTSGNPTPPPRMLIEFWKLTSAAAAEFNR